jgi:transcriptional regulator of acetoin/glycerol metabolism
MSARVADETVRQLAGLGGLFPDVAAIAAELLELRSADVLGMTMQEARRFVLVAALERNRGNIVVTAKQLDVSARQIHRQIDDWGIDMVAIRGGSQREGGRR